jgi:hypothetical protein
MAKQKPSAPRGKDQDVLPVAKEPGAMHESPVWRFRYIDVGGQWCWTKLKDTTLSKVLQKLSDFETMTWKEILGKRHHHLSWDSLSPEAQKRIRELDILDYADYIYSLAIEGKPRVIGLLRDHIFYILWWDPDHEVCPSSLSAEADGCGCSRQGTLALCTLIL